MTNAVTKFHKYFFFGELLAIVILLFSIVDHALHGLNENWGVPDYYFQDKIPFGFLWGLVGLWLARYSRNLWIKSLILSATISITLQVRYFYEGYPIGFVLIFLFFHFVILYFLSVIMFWTMKNIEKTVKKIFIVFLILTVTAIATNYLVF